MNAGLGTAAQLLEEGHAEGNSCEGQKPLARRSWRKMGLDAAAVVGDFQEQGERDRLRCG